MKKPSYNRMANLAPDKDWRTPMSVCPLQRDDIQLVPMRYALVETEKKHAAIQSQYAGCIGYRPIGIRAMEQGGHLYLIHGQRDDLIHHYRLTDDTGELAKAGQTGLDDGPIDGETFVDDEPEFGPALVVKRIGAVHLLYSRAPLSVAQQRQLLREPERRQRLMQRIDLARFDAYRGGPHLLPPDALVDTLADSDQTFTLPDLPLIPASPPVPPRPEAWIWEAQPPEQYPSDYIRCNILPQFHDDSAFVLLEDPIGLMNELAGASLGVARRQSEWLADDDNEAKYFAASQLTLMMTLEAEQFERHSDNALLHRYIEAFPDAITARYEAYIEAHEAWLAATKRRGLSRGVQSVAPELEDAYQHQREQNQAMADHIGLPRSELERTFRRLRRERKTLLEGTAIRPGILPRIDDDNMAAWYHSAHRQLVEWDAQLAQLDDDRLALLPEAYAALAVYDKANPEALLARLQTETHWLAHLGHREENRAALRGFFFAELGEQNTQLLQPPQASPMVLDWGGVTLKLLQGLDSVAAGEAPLDALEAALQGQQFTLMDNLPDEVQQQYSLLGLQLSNLSLLELDALLQQGEGLQQQADALTRHLRPGLAALLLGHRHNAKLTLSYGDAEGARQLDRALNELTDLRQQAEAHVRRINTVERDFKSRTAAEKDGIRATLRAELHQLGETGRQRWAQLQARAEPLAKTGGRHSPTQVVIALNGQSLEQANAIRTLKQQVLHNELLYGNAEGHWRLNGSVGAGSLAFMMMALELWNWGQTAQALGQKSQWSLAQEMDYASDLLSASAATLSLTTELLRTATLKAHFAALSEASANAVGRVVTLGTTGVAGLAFAASVADGFVQAPRLQQSWQRRDMAALSGAALALAGDGLQGWHSGKVALVGWNAIMGALSRQITWTAAARVTLGAALAANPWLLAATALLIGGELLYNASQSSPLMRWISACAWGRDARWYRDGRQDWDAATQLTHWLEVTQTPQLAITTQPVRQRVHFSQREGHAVYALRPHLATLHLTVPQARPHQVRLAGALYFAGDDAPVDITQSNLLKQPRVAFDGLNTHYAFDWPQDPEQLVRLQSLDLLVEVTCQTGTVLFAEQGGARYSLNLQQLDDLPPARQDGPQPIAQLDADDQQRTSIDTLKAALTPLQPRSTP